MCAMNQQSGEKGALMRIFQKLVCESTCVNGLDFKFVFQVVEYLLRVLLGTTRKY